jgi:hypothetical protein
MAAQPMKNTDPIKQIIINLSWLCRLSRERWLREIGARRPIARTLILFREKFVIFNNYLPLLTVFSIKVLSIIFCALFLLS